jgi:putative flippase GtrA
MLGAMTWTGRWQRLGTAYAAWCAHVVARLPVRLRRVVAPSMVGFALINSTTFAIDIAVVTLVHGAFGLPLVLAVTAGYGVALSLGFLLNRTLNFRVHGEVGRQAGRYAVVVGTNFLVLLLGVTTLLSSAGVPYQLSRLVAGACEGVFMYVAMRWFVFRQQAAAPDVA